MGLKKDITDKGVVSGYQKILGIGYDAVRDYSDIIVGYYASKDYRMTHPDEIMKEETFKMVNSGLKTFSGNVYSLYYDFLKTLPEFSGATDE